MNIQPISDILLVKQEDFTDRKSGLYIPESFQTTNNLTGTVYAVGPDVIDVMEGDKVILIPLKFLTVKNEGVTYLVVRHKEVLGTLV